MTNQPSSPRSIGRKLDLGAFSARRARIALLTAVGVGAFVGTSPTAAQATGFDIGLPPTTTVQIGLSIAQPLPQPDPDPDFPIAQPDPQPDPDLPIAQPTEPPDPDPNHDLPLALPTPQPDPTPDFPFALPAPDETDPSVDAGGLLPGSGETAGTHLPSTGAATGLIAALAAALTAVGAAATFTARRRSA